MLLLWNLFLTLSQKQLELILNQSISFRPSYTSARYFVILTSDICSGPQFCLFLWHCFPWFLLRKVLGLYFKVGHGRLFSHILQVHSHPPVLPSTSIVCVIKSASPSKIIHVSLHQKLIYTKHKLYSYTKLTLIRGFGRQIIEEV
jgi:hypothetical protein